MNIFILDNQTLGAGRSSFHDYLKGAICGPAARAEYERAMSRWSGIAILPGVIDAMIEQGIHDYDAIVCGAARVSGCRRSTVRKLVEAMTESIDESHRWLLSSGKLFMRESTSGGEMPQFLIAA